tara:strand:- start:801 stop:1433 length:633 start_codon:yes stop_codon:yes gene_type:complete
MKNIAIFASGSGSNFQAIHQYIKKGEISGEILLVVSNNSNSGAIKYAKENNMSTFIVNNFLYPNIEDYNRLLIKKLNKNSIDLIVLAGYMKLLPLEIVKAYHNRILNIHPALLPKFGGKGYYGNRVHEAVIASGDLESGVTVHFVDEEYDNGEIIAQETVRVIHNDTSESLAKRVLKVEHRLYPKVVKAFCENRIIRKNNKFKIEEVVED